MHDYDSAVQGLRLNYYIVAEEKERKVNTKLHIYDELFEELLPALWYVLHLPRHGFDVISVPPAILSKGLTQHNIILISSELSQENKEVLSMYPPTLFISEDACCEKVHKLSEKYSAPLACSPFSMLSSELLRKHWKEIAKLISKTTNINSLSNVNPRLFEEEERSVLPITFKANHARATDLLYSKLKVNNFSFQARLFGTLRMQTFIDTHLKFQEENREADSEIEFQNELEKKFNDAKVPLVITLPGTPSSGRAYKIPKRKNNIGNVENSLINFLGVQRAAANGGTWLDGNILPKELFINLHKLEEHFCSPYRKNNSFIWNSMRKLGGSLGNHLNIAHFSRVFSDTSHITAFTDFPIGVAIFPGVDDPLCCILPISYRPLTPLTSALAYGLPQVNSYYIGAGKGFKITIVECVSKSDNIRLDSDQAWKEVLHLLEKNSIIEVEYKEILSVRELNGFFENPSIEDIDILVISAHGKYTDEGSLAGLQIGDEEEVWIHNSESRVPPIVILSACHVAPRGKGAYTVNDAFLNAGAFAVLGTLIPIKVDRNALLTLRFFQLISNVLDGQIKCRTLAEAWQRTVASNAIYEIIDSSKKLKDWAYSKNDKGISPLDEYFEEILRKPLKYGNVYNGTLNTLRKIARNSGKLNYLDSVLNSNGFFPESCFYVFCGYPEQVIIGDAVFEEAIEMGIEV